MSKKEVQDMEITICPRCGTENSSSAMNCKQCRINLKFVLEHPEAIEPVKKVENTSIESTPKDPKPVKNWQLIGLLAGVIPGLIIYFLTLGAPAGVAITICIGPGGIVGGIIGANIGKRNKSTVWIAAVLISILGAALLFILAIFTCVFCM